MRHAKNDKTVAPSVKPQGVGNQPIEKRTYHYVLDVDYADRIIGGDWIGQTSNPDLIWRQNSSVTSSGFVSIEYSPDGLIGNQ